MTARFAGSRTLDERRRRWLASNENERAAQTSPKAAAENEPDMCEDVSVASNLRHFPIRKLISPKPWKISLVGLLVTAAGLLIVWASQSGWEHLGPGWQRLIQPDHRGIARLFQAGLLLASSQLALLIWWGRSQSLKDFEGQYRIWLWAGLALMTAACSLLGQWHWAASETICWLWTARFPQREIVCWLLPGLVIAGILWRKLLTDVRDCPTSWLLLWLTAEAVLAAGVYRLGIDRTGWPDSTRQLISATLQMLACLGAFLSFLTHARHVIHVSAEPPEVRTSVWSKLIAGLSNLITGLKTSVKKLPMPKIAFPKFWKRTPKTQDQAETKKAKPASKAEASKPKELPAEKPAAKKSTSRSSAKTPRATSQADSEPATKEPVPTEPAPVVKKAEAKPSKPTAPEPPPKAVAEAPKAVVEDPKPKPEPPKPQPPVAQKPVPAPPLNEVDEDDDSDADSSDDPNLRLDQPIDPGSLKGLSKKERRRLRKQHQEAKRKNNG